MADVSIIIPARNSAATIPDTIRSCLACPEVREVLVVVHRSNDSTVEVVRSFADDRVNCIEDPGTGISRAMNIGIERSSGAYVAKIDSDDTVPPDRFAWQTVFLATNPDFIGVCGSFTAIDEQGRMLSAFASGTPARNLSGEYREGKRPTHFGSWLSRIDAVRGIGGFREWFVTAEDIDIAYRLAMAGPVWFEPKDAYAYRIRASSITHTQPNRLRSFYETQAAVFLEQRKARGSDDLDDGMPPPLPEPDGDETGDVMNPAAQAEGFETSYAWRLYAEGQKARALGKMGRLFLASPSRHARGLTAMTAKALGLLR